MKTTNVKVTCLEDFDVIEINLPNGGQYLIRTFDNNLSKIHLTHVCRGKEIAVIIPSTNNVFDVTCVNLDVKP